MYERRHSISDSLFVRLLHLKSTHSTPFALTSAICYYYARVALVHTSTSAHAHNIYMFKCVCAVGAIFRHW